MIRTVLSVVCLAGLAAMPARASDDASPIVETAPPAVDYLDVLRDRLDAAMDDPRMVGLVAAVIEDGEPVFIYTQGETAAGSGEAVTRQTLFRAASVSKTFTGTLLGLLEAEGVLDLEAPVPGDVLRLQGPRQPTLEDIASHRTGLPPNAYDLDLEAGQAPSRIRERLARVDLLCPVG